MCQRGGPSTLPLHAAATSTLPRWHPAQPVACLYNPGSLHRCAATWGTIAVTFHELIDLFRCTLRILHKISSQRFGIDKRIDHICRLKIGPLRLPALYFYIFLELLYFCGHPHRLVPLLPRTDGNVDDQRPDYNSTLLNLANTQHLLSRHQEATSEISQTSSQARHHHPHHSVYPFADSFWSFDAIHLASLPAAVTPAFVDTCSGEGFGRNLFITKAVGHLP